MAKKSLEEQLDELDAKRKNLRKQIRDRDKRERQRADAALLRAVKDCFGDDITAKQIRERFGEQRDAEPLIQASEASLEIPKRQQQ